MCSGRVHEFECETDGGEEARWIGGTFPSNIERGAMIDAGANDRQAEGGVHCVVKCQCLKGYVPLIVIHADKDIGRATLGGMKAVSGGSGPST